MKQKTYYLSMLLGFLSAVPGTLISEKMIIGFPIFFSLAVVFKALKWDKSETE